MVLWWVFEISTTSFSFAKYDCDICHIFLLFAMTFVINNYLISFFYCK